MPSPSAAAPSHFRSAALRVYSAIFEETFFQVADGRDKEKNQPIADFMSRIFKQEMVERIEAAIRGEQVEKEKRERKTAEEAVYEARARKKVDSK